MGASCEYVEVPLNTDKAKCSLIQFPIFYILIISSRIYKHSHSLYSVKGVNLSLRIKIECGLQRLLPPNHTGGNNCVCQIAIAVHLLELPRMNISFTFRA